MCTHAPTCACAQVHAAAARLYAPTRLHMHRSSSRCAYVQVLLHMCTHAYVQVLLHMRLYAQVLFQPAYVLLAYICTPCLRMHMHLYAHAPICRSSSSLRQARPSCGHQSWKTSHIRKMSEPTTRHCPSQRAKSTGPTFGSTSTISRAHMPAGAPPAEPPLSCGLAGRPTSLGL